MNKYDWVIFDFGGTLNSELDTMDHSIDKENSYGIALLEWFNRIICHSVNKSEHEMELMIGEAGKYSAGKTCQHNIRQNIETYINRLEWVYRQVGVTREISELEREACYCFMMWKVFEHKAHPLVKNVTETLEFLLDNGVRLAVLSNNAGYVADKLLSHGANHYFEFILDSARMGCVKPDLRIFQKTAEKTGALPERLLYVGDNFIADFMGAISAGWNAAWLATEQMELDYRPILADYCNKGFVIRSIADLMKKGFVVL